MKIAGNQTVDDWQMLRAKFDLDKQDLTAFGKT
jgi:hypothetical protein